MEATTQLKGIKYRLNDLLEDVELAIEQAEKEKRNVKLSRPECNEVMGYSDPNYIYRIGVDHLMDEDKKIWFDDLYEWAKEHKPNRLKRMRRNIKKYNKG